MILIQENNNDNRIGTTLLKSKSYQLNTLILKKEKILQKKKAKNEWPIYRLKNQTRNFSKQFKKIEIHI